MNNENKLIIKAINMFGRVPEQYELLEEIERLTISLQAQEECYKTKLKGKDKEIERLSKKLENLEKLNNANYQSFIEVNNIINEFERWLKEEIRIFEDGKDDEYEGLIYNIKIIVLDKLQELKEGTKNE